ncbi:MAG: hypothetical protein OEM84_14535 [Acidimicrobiia bacterium]|nr:hypothetical protein [Acidimicrobiia bacterium]
MSCIALSGPHRRLLIALTRGPRQVADRESIDELRRGEWVFGSEVIGLGPCEAYG